MPTAARVNRLPSKLPTPWAPYGTLLHLIQLAHAGSRGESVDHGRSGVLAVAQSHGGLLLGTAVSEDLCEFVRRSTNPWATLADEVRKAQGQQAPVKSRRQFLSAMRQATSTAGRAL